MIASLQSWVSDFRAALFPAGSLRGRLVTGTFWVLLGTAVSQGLQLAATVFIARWIGKSEYGELGIVTSTVGMFGIFVGLGLGLTATKYVSELRRIDPRRAGRIAALTLTIAVASGSAVTLLLVVLSPWLAVHTLASRSVTTPLEIGAGLLFFGELNGVQNGILSGLEAFGAVARVSLWAGLCSFPIIVLFTWSWGLNGAVVGLVVSAALNCVLSNAALRREAERAGVPISFSASWKERAVLWTFSTPAFLASAVVTPVTWICSTLLVNQPNGYAEMGLFNAANQWRNAIMFLPGIVSRVVLPILSSHCDESVEPSSRFSNALEAGYSTGIMVAFPLITALSFGGGVVTKAYGTDFAGIRYPLAGVLYAAGVMAIGCPIGLSVQAKGAMWLGFVFNLSWGLFLLGSFYFFLLRLGAWGLALAYALSYFVLMLTFGWYFCRAGYFPWSLGVRTYLACLSVLLFAFLPLCLPASISSTLSPIAVGLSMAVVWLFLPLNVRTRLVSGWALWRRPA
jgi:O-antigen/teichoic acid export membrane protein